MTRLERLVTKNYMMMLKMRLIHSNSPTRVNLVQRMPSTLLYSSLSNSQKHMQECSVLILAQPLTPLSPTSYWRTGKQGKPALHLEMLPLFSHWQLTTCWSQPNPFSLFDHKHRCSPGMRQYSITLHTLHKRLYIHNL